MISDFIYKYYIDPIKTGQAYNVVDTLTYAIILVIGIYLIYRWMSGPSYMADVGFRFDEKFILATVPYIILGGVLRVIEDTGMITSDWRFLLITPLIYFVLFFFTISMMYLARFLTLRGITTAFISFYALAGTAALVISSLILLAWSTQHNGVDLFILAIIPLMAVTATAIVYAVMRYALGWTYVTDPLYITLLFGQLLDASATSYGIDFHPHIQYVEQHVVGSTLIDLTGTAFVMFPLKLLVLFPAVYVMQMYRKEANPAFWHLVLLAMMVVGFAPGVRDMVRMVLYV
jgi:uncharacterized membrane protein